MERDEELKEIEQQLGVIFLNKSLLNQSFTHSSYGHENSIPDNERLEFLGDAVIKLIISEDLYNRFPERAEGDLTKIRAAVVADTTFAQIAKKLHLGTYLLLGQNEKKTGGRIRKSNLANTFEALVGALYLDAGLGKVRDFILSNLKDEIEKVSRIGYTRDYKSTLQEYVQKMGWKLPSYKVSRETGPKHKRIFWMSVRIKGKIFGYGKGLNKKEAEQKAAFFALRELKKERNVRPAD